MPGPFVILDTNALHGDPYLQGGQVARLLALSRRSRIELAVPDVVLRELQRQQQRTIAGRIDHLKKAEAKIRESFQILQLRDSDYQISLPDFQDLNAKAILDDLYGQVRTRLEANLVEILPIPSVDHQTLLARDLSGRLPFSPTGKGYRDALIWHSILERWASTPLFEDAFIVTGDEDFGKDELDPVLRTELPIGSEPVKVESIKALLRVERIASLHAALQREFEDAALKKEDSILRAELSGRDAHELMHDAAEAAVRSAVDSLSTVALSNVQRDSLRVAREFEELDLIGAVGKGDFEWSLYDQLDGETFLGQGSMTAEIELSAEVDKENAALLADPEVNVESWTYDAAQVSFWLEARLTFDLRVDLAGAVVEDTTLSGIESAE